MKYFKFSDDHGSQGDLEQLHPSPEWCHPKHKNRNKKFQKFQNSFFSIKKHIREQLVEAIAGASQACLHGINQTFLKAGEQAPQGKH